jgi:purine-cytosine permease-like protein
MSQSPNRLLGIFLGVLYLLDGVYGFFLTSDTPFASTSGPKIFDLFETNPLHNLLHLVVGLALLTPALVGPRAAKTMNTTMGAIYLLVGVVGLLLSSGNNPLNVLAINGADNIQNFVTAVLLLCVGLGADPVVRSPKTV